jgi:hypothetical protein
MNTGVNTEIREVKRGKAVKPRSSTDSQMWF